jgi:hypothetical protein
MARKKRSAKKRPAEKKSLGRPRKDVAVDASTSRQVFRSRLHAPA